MSTPIVRVHLVLEGDVLFVSLFVSLVLLIAYLFIFMTIRLPAYLSANVFVCSSLCPCVCPSVYLHLSPFVYFTTRVTPRTHTYKPHTQTNTTHTHTNHTHHTHTHQCRLTTHLCVLFTACEPLNYFYVVFSSANVITAVLRDKHNHYVGEKASLPSPNFHPPPSASHHLAVISPWSAAGGLFLFLAY